MEEFKGIVKSEILWVQYIINNFPLYIMTSDKNRTIYYLYKYSEKDNKYIKTNHQSQDPIKLEEKYVKYNSSEIIKSKSTENKNKMEINVNVDKKVQEKTEKIIAPTENNNINNKEISIKDSTNSTSTPTPKRRGRPPKNKDSEIKVDDKNNTIKEPKTIIHNANTDSIKPPENNVNTAFSKVVNNSNSKPNKPKPKKGRLF